MRRLIIGLLAAGLLAACKAPGDPQVAMPRDDAERTQIVSILAQGMFGPSNPRETVVAHWTEPLRIAVIGRSAEAQRALFDQAVAPFMADFEAITGVHFRHVSEAEANVLVIMAEDVESLRRDFAPQMDRVLLDPHFTASFLHAVEELNGQCSYMALDADYAYFGAVVFSSVPESDPHFAECLTPSPAGMVGLQGELNEPGSIKSRGAQLLRPTELDRKALRILYGSRPGQMLRDIPALQDSI